MNEEYFMNLAEKELRGPFKGLKLNIVRQSLPALFVCGAREDCVANEIYFRSSVIERTNYDPPRFIPAFVFQAILVAVIQWLVTHWLDKYFEEQA